MAWFILIFGGAIALLLPARILAGDATVLIVTFLGLVVAGALPAITLMVGSIWSPARSVARVDAMKREVGALMDALLGIVWLSILAAILAVIHQVGIPDLPATISTLTVPGWAQSLPNTILQAALVAVTLLVINRTRLIGTAYRTVLQATYEAAREESVKRAEERAPSRAEIERGFAKSERFGERISVVASSGEGR